MQNRLTGKIKEYLGEHLQKKRWQRVIIVLSCIVVFCTTYALIIPALTMTKKPACGLEEHIHDESCYETVVTAVKLDCKFTPHVHSESCYDESGDLICGYADYVIHEHSENCYDESGKLVCTLPEIKEHAHSSSCFEEETSYICALEESEGHEHDNDCYDENGELTCTLEESKGHTHTQDCKKTESKLVCKEKEVVFHSHTAECYTGEKLSCGKIEVLRHNHDERCFAESTTEKRLICTKEEHQHDEVKCYPDEEVESEYICGFTEHKHSDDCRDKDGNLVCNVPEHEHSEKCRSTYEYPVAVIGKKIDDSVTVTVEGKFDEESEFTAKVLDDDILEKLRKSLNTNNGLDFGYELSLEYDGKDVKPDGGIKVTIDGLKLGSVSSKLKFKGFLLAKDEKGTPTEVQKLSVLENSFCFETESVSTVYLFAESDNNADIIGEPGDPTAFLKLQNSGYFDYWQKIIESRKQTSSNTSAQNAHKSARAPLKANSAAGESDVQVKNRGGEKRSDDGVVTVSKTIKGTELENVFDITLKVNTKEELKTFYKDPDASIVIVMDISNTMTYAFGNTTRYQAAMSAAENFIDKFAEESDEVSKIGYVAFNTNAKKIFDLQPCADSATAQRLKNTMRTETGKVINYADSHERFTNIEAGLKLGRDMLAGSKNKHKYIIFLSDGFPTTYISGGYNGYDPYCTSGTPGSNGVFYDSVTKKYCLYGTSYSDKAAIRARQMATNIKNQGMKIFSIGIDIGGQTIKTYVDQTAGKYFSVVDRTGTSYEIGSASSTQAYKNWLKSKIGSDYYYDSTDQTGLIEAYQKIFDEMKRFSEQEMASLWVTVDPIPATIDPHKVIDFIGFYDINGTLVDYPLAGQNDQGSENTASYNEASTVINWDLKKSGYTKTVAGSVTTYYYELVYRVRLGNEKNGFVERKVYNTNDPTYLKYQTIVNVDGVKNYSEIKTVEFPIPSVEGYLSEFSFMKMSSLNELLPSAVFTLKHDTEKCSICRGDKTSTPVKNFTASPGSDGIVRFSGIPSGHIYTLEETTIPEGYFDNGDKYSVKVAYDKIEITVTHTDGSKETWNTGSSNTIINYKKGYTLPATGSAGTLWLTMGGLLLIAGNLLMGLGLRRKKERRFG